MFDYLGDLQTTDRYQLPEPHPCQICYWGGSSPDTGGSQQMIMASQANALAAEQAMYNQARQDVAPWREAGGAGLKQYAGLLGIPGYQAIDQTKMLESTPGYKFLQDQGTQGLARYGAATGMGMSGPAMKSAQNYGQNLAQTYAWGPYMSALQGLQGQGLQAGGMSGNWAMQTGQNMANTYMQGGNQLAQLQMQQQMMDAQQQSSGWNDLMSGVGFLGGLAMAPMTGGTSLLGSGMSALGGLFGGGGGGPSGGYGYGNTGYSNSMNPYFMAEGGPTEANQPYIIGERGPEMFVPSVPGYIVPNHELTNYSAFAPYRS